MGFGALFSSQQASAQCTLSPSYTEDFSSYTPTCWTEASGRLNTATTLSGTSSDWGADGFLNSGTTGSARMNIWSTTKDEWLLSPIIDLGTTAYQLEFDAGLTAFSSSGTELMGVDDTLAVVISLDSGDTWSSANILKLYVDGNQPSNTGETVIIDLTPYSGKVKFGFYAASSVSNTDYNVYIDNFAVNPLATCPKPSTLMASNISASGATFSWLENGTATSWEVEYDTTGFTLGSGNNSIYNADSAVFTGLLSNTTYDAYVRAVCAPGDTSAWVGPLSISTLCNALSIPFTETFNSTSNTESCWLVRNENNDGDTWDLGNTSNTLEGDQSAAINTDFNSGNNDDYLISPAITVTGNERVSYFTRARSVSEPNDYLVMVSTTGTMPADFTDTLLVDTVSSTSYSERIIDLSAYTGNIHVAFHIPSGGLDGWILYIDSVKFEAIPNCLAPSALTTSLIGVNSATFSWTENGTATAWEVEYDTVGFTPGTGNKISATTQTANLSGLIANSDYQIYVRAICGPADSSSWAGPITFTTLCAPYAAPYVEDFNTFVPACWEEASTGDLSTGPATLGSGDWRVGDFANNTVNGGGARINLYTTSRTEWLVSPTIDLSSGTYELAIDAAVTNWNTSAADNMGSDDSVQVVVSTDGGLTWTSIYTWDVNNEPPTLGQEYRISLSGYTTSNNIFGIYATDGPIDDTEDYDFHIGRFEVRVPPSCPTPIVNAASLIGTDSAIVSWVETGSSTQWEVEFGPIGYTLGSGTSTIVNIDTFMTINSLTSNSSYDYYVRSICAIGDTSNWSTATTFTTNFLNCAPTTAVTLPFFEGWESNTDTVNGPSNVICNADYTWYLLSSDPTGRARFGTAAVQASTGSGAITLDRDPSGSDITNDLILTLDMSNYLSSSRLELSFDFAHHGEENQDNDSVWVRGSDTNDWVGIYDLYANRGTAGVYNVVAPFDVDAILGAAGQTVSSSFQVRFGQEDNFPATSTTASDGFSFDNISIIETPHPYYPVGVINTVDTNGVADSLNITCFTSGTVAGVDLDGNNGISFTIIDQSSSTPEGISIFNFNDVSGYVVNEGDSIMVRGDVDQFNGLTQLFVDSIMVISTGSALPSHTLVTTLDETTESQLIRMENLTVTNVPSGSSKNIDLTDGTNNFTMRVDADTDVLDSLTFNVGDVICSVNGIGGQFDNSNPFTSGYQIFPMRYTDVVFAPTVDLGPDTIVCDTAGFMLDAGAFASYMWNTGDTTQMITPNDTVSQYIVTVMDANGCSATDTVDVTVTICVGINEVAKNNATISFFPNPNNGQFKLEIDNVKALNSTIEVVSVNGQIVYSENLNINGSLSKDISLSVEKGLYFVRLINDNGVKVEKLIIR